MNEKLEKLKQDIRDLYEKYPYDHETAHSISDDMLLTYIGDEELTKLVMSRERWCA